MRRHLALVLVAFTLLVSTALAGCSSKKSTTSPPVASNPPSAASTETAATSNALTIAGFKYSPLPLTVKAGATVTVTNDDATDHTASSSPAGAFAVTVSKGSPQTFTAPTTPGTYKIICSFHPAMLGQLVVTA